MNTIEIRQSLHQQIELLDEKFLRAVHAMVATYIEIEPTIGTTIEGTPMTLQDLEEQIEKGETQINNGEFYTIQELENNTKKWFNTKL